MTDHNLDRALAAQRAKVLNSGTSDGARTGWKSRLMSIHSEHLGGASPEDDSGYSSNGKWVSPQRTFNAMADAHEGEDLDTLARRYLGHETMKAALGNDSGRYHNGHFISVADHAKAIKAASEEED